MKVVLLVVAVLLVALVIAQMAAAVWHNDALARGYVPKDGTYAEAVAAGNVNLAEVSKYFPDIEALIAYEYANVISAPVPIRYYERIADKAPALTIDKGAGIAIRREGRSTSLTVDVGHGLDSLPTIERGWRLAVPFSHDGDSGELLYVRFSDLQKVCRAWVQANPNLAVIGSQRGLTKGETIRRMVTSVDQALYDQGVFCSEDLKRPILSGLSIGMLIVAAIAVGLFVKANR